jgi:hypothetical protein
MNDILPGTRILVFDSSLFKDDIKTPLSNTVRPATVVCRYGCYGQSRLTRHYKYSDLVDVVFDHRPDKVSTGHFTNGVKVIGEER